MEICRVNTEEQLQVLAATASEIWHEFFPYILTDAQIDYMVEKFQSYEAMKKQMKNGYVYYLFMIENQVAGYTGICPGEENGKKKLFLSKLYLKKAFRGQGLASKAFLFLEDYCKENSLEAIWLTVNRHNAHTISVYEKKGFVTVREQVADIGNGYVMDDYVMEKYIG